MIKNSDSINDCLLQQLVSGHIEKRLFGIFGLRDVEDLVQKGSVGELLCNRNHRAIIFKSVKGESGTNKSSKLILDLKKGNCKEKQIFKDKMELFKEPACSMKAPISAVLEAHLLQNVCHNSKRNQSGPKVACISSWES